MDWCRTTKDSVGLNGLMYDIIGKFKGWHRIHLPGVGYNGLVF